MSDHNPPDDAGRQAVPMPAAPSLGMLRVRASFNPSGNREVDVLKSMSVLLIDKCEELKKAGHDARCCALAQTAFEEGAMWAVKAATDGK